MKKIFFFLFLLSSIITLAQNDLRTKDSLALFGPTAVGKPDGEKVSMEIGTSGGHLISSDGKVELIFPVGALTSPTTISIQPAINLALDGVAKAYNMDPAGIHFQEQVQLVFHYTNKDMDGNSPQLMGLAFQDEKGSWFGLRKLNLDTIAKTITGYIKHFCSWALGWSYHFAPEKTRIKVLKDVDIIAIPRPISEEDAGEHGEVFHGIYGPTYSNTTIWTVNNIHNGDPHNGTILCGGCNFPLLQNGATYRAPASVPDQNPVEVMLQIVGADQGLDNGKTYTMTKTCKIWIYDDQYEVKMTASNHNGLIGNGSLNADLVDSGSFIVFMEGKRSRVVDIKNNLYKFTNKSGLKIEYLNEATCTGPINITGVKEMRITWADPPKQPYSIVEIQFMPAKMSLPQFKVNGKDATIPIALGSMLSMMPAWPMFIRFVAKEGEQTIWENHDNGTTMFFTVRRLEE